MSVKAIKDASIARKIIARSIVYTNKFATYKNIERIKIYIESLILNITNNKLKRKKIRKLRSINLRITLFANKR